MSPGNRAIEKIIESALMPDDISGLSDEIERRIMRRVTTHYFCNGITMRCSVSDCLVCDHPERYDRPPESLKVLGGYVYFKDGKWIGLCKCGEKHYSMPNSLTAVTLLLEKCHNWHGERYKPPNLKGH